MLLHVLAPGKVCAAGSFGEHRRAWCAIVEHGPGGAKVNVFHQATHVRGADASGSDTELVFTPRAFYDFDPGNETSHLLLLDRGFAGPPLTINPATLEVAQWGTRPCPSFAADAEWCANGKGEILALCDGRLEQLARPGTTFAKGQTTQPFVVHPGNGVQLQVGGLDLLQYHGSIYVAGGLRRGDWFRIDPDTFRTEILTWDGTSPLENPWPGSYAPKTWCSVSSHYGLVGGCRDNFGRSPFRFFQVTVEEPDKGDTPPAGQPRKSASGQP
jgi:hypothetical protein